MSSKFGSLAASVEETFKVTIIDPVTDRPIDDKTGATAYVEVYSVDSDTGRAIDREQGAAMLQRLQRGRRNSDDGLEQNVDKLARLTKAWLLIDPVTREQIDVPCNSDNARELYSGGGTAYIFRQVWLGANDAANFIRRSSTIS